MIGLAFTWWYWLWQILTDGSGEWPYMPIFLALASPGLLLVAAGLPERHGIELEEDGLTFVGLTGRRRHVPWAEIEGFHDQGLCATFTVAGRRIVLDERIVGWRRLVREMERHLHPDAESASAASEVAAEEVARCLGIPVDGALHCRPPYNFYVLLIWLAAAMCLVAPAMSYWAATLALLAVLGIGHAAAGREQRSRAVTADVSGLVARRGRKRWWVPWSVVRHVDRRAAPQSRFYLSSTEYEADREVRVTTDEGVFGFLLSDSGGRALAGGMAALLAARDAGHALPSRGPLSDAAISHVRLTAEGDAERGLSRVREGESTGEVSAAGGGGGR
jgi:hypothetical protein